MILLCESCDEYRKHYERIVGSISTLAERVELVCNECGDVTHTRKNSAWVAKMFETSRRREVPRQPVVRLRFDIGFELPVSSTG